MGGYSTGVIANQKFCFKIPDGLEAKYACSMLCAGLTVYSPLLRNGVTKGSKVAVVGIGGLGHYAILFAKAMGAEVYAFTHSQSKIADVKKMGADVVVDTADEDSFAQKMPREFDVIMFTRDVSADFPLANYLKWALFICFCVFWIRYIRHLGCLPSTANLSLSVYLIILYQPSRRLTC